MRETSKDKTRFAQERMDELRAIHKKLAEERTEKGRDMERRRVRIEQTEKKVCYLIPIFRSPILTISDGGPKRKHRERNPQRTRRVLEDGFTHQTIHHRNGTIHLINFCRVWAGCIWILGVG